MKKSIFTLAFLLLLSCNFVLGQVCYEIRHEGSKIIGSIVATGDYMSPPTNIWTVSNVTLSWSDTLGTNVINSFLGLNGFPFSIDGPPKIMGDMVYQKMGYAGQNLSIDIPAGGLVDVFSMSVSHSSISVANFNIEETPPIINGNIAFANVFTNQIVSGTCDPISISLVLPLELIKFDAILKEENVLLHWSSAFEQNIDFYEIEKSEDTRSWHTIGNVNAAGDTESLTNYFFTDNQAFNNVNRNDLFYRLKSIEKDGSSTYSSVKKVTILRSSDIVFYPNPAQRTVFMSLQSERNETGIVHIYDQTGRLLSQQEFIVQTGNNEVSLSLKDFAAGAYFTKVILEGQVFHHWLVVGK